MAARLVGNSRYITRYITRYISCVPQSARPRQSA